MPANNARSAIEPGAIIVSSFSVVAQVNCDMSKVGSGP